MDALDALKAITSGKAAIDGIKVLAEYADGIKDVQKRGEFMRIIGELSIKLAETQMKLAEQTQDNINLKEKINALEKEVEKLKNPKSKPIIKDGLYYIEDDGPFCPGCYDNNNKLIRVSEAPDAMKVLGRYRCQVCKAQYK
ncbi:hypothetical protein [Nostoc sp. WHI]|uniref:hypothetical protein n=1 Tax=Nostoc sp. WHI TaxID=2650611 RepID=UPI0018C83C4E|nr:hypothetical protein [Nostoc sp. WHI]MBG1270797.1 hypothetical protein [Nostoc sp. WHI]